MPPESDAECVVVGFDGALWAGGGVGLFTGAVFANGFGAVVVAGADGCRTWASCGALVAVCLSRALWACVGLCDVRFEAWDACFFGRDADGDVAVGPDSTTAGAATGVGGAATIALSAGARS